MKFLSISISALLTLEHTKNFFDGNLSINSFNKSFLGAQSNYFLNYFGNYALYFLKSKNIQNRPSVAIVNPCQDIEQSKIKTEIPIILFFGF